MQGKVLPPWGQYNHVVDDTHIPLQTLSGIKSCIPCLSFLASRDYKSHSIFQYAFGCREEVLCRHHLSF